jgi:hypothetical protein
VHYPRRPKGQITVARGPLGERSYAVPFDDHVKLRVQLSRPGYLYLLGFNANGSEQLFWPPQTSEAPARLSALEYPAGQAAVLTLDDEPRGGVQAFAVVAGLEPLPAYSQWKTRRPPVTWRRLGVGDRAEMVWRGNGQWLDELFPGGLRAKQEVLGELQTLAELGPALRQCPGVAEVSLLAFPVWPKAIR